MFANILLIILVNKNTSTKMYILSISKKYVPNLETKNYDISLTKNFIFQLLLSNTNILFVIYAKIIEIKFEIVVLILYSTFNLSNI